MTRRGALWRLSTSVAILALTARGVFAGPPDSGTLPSAPSRTGRVVPFSGPAMGTRYGVSVVMAAADEEACRRVQATIDDELALVDRVFSRWNPDSELSRFNARLTTEPMAVTAELLELVLAARRVSETSGGAFDATVTPLLEAWSFGPRARQPAPPSAEALATAKDRVGYERLTADAARGTLAKARPDVSVDLDGIVAGWLADRVAARLRALGHADVLVDMGGEVAARGRRLDGQPWRVAIEPPPGSSAPRTATVRLEDAALATSGDYRRFWTDEEGRRRSHIVDPRTGQTVAHGLASVTVVHGDGAWADALGTALLVLGPVEARTLATREQWAVRLVERRPDGTSSEWSSPEFDRLLVR